MEELRFDSRIMHPEVQSVSRTGVTESLKQNRVTTPYFTKYEYVTLIGTRAQQIAEGAKPLISLEKMMTSDPQFVWKVAEKEIFERKLPFIVHRRLPSGNSEFWSASELSVMW
jgi:DNA-directed RNA polymerase I, II, and III subunit RPABC2